jgi:hypothetical protein
MKHTTRSLASANNPLGHTPEHNPNNHNYGYDGNPDTGSRADAQSVNNPRAAKHPHAGKTYHPIARGLSFC